MTPPAPHHYTAAQIALALSKRRQSNGRDFRLTDVFGKVVKDIMA